MLFRQISLLECSEVVGGGCGEKYVAEIKEICLHAGTSEGGEEADLFVQLQVFFFFF